MRIFSLITSVIALLLSLYYMITDFPNLDSFEGLIYFCILFILILICITGIIINIPIHKVHKKI